MHRFLKGGIKMNRHKCGIFIALMVIAGILGLLAAPGALAETYTSSTWEYPVGFDNNMFATNNNDLQHLDAVYFGGRELVIFSLFSSDDAKYNKNLYFHTISPKYHLTFDVGNDPNIDFKFKTCVYNDVLYLFYTPQYSNSGYSTGTIYYRMVTVNYGTVENPTWSLNVSSLKSFSAGHSSAKIRTAATMNGNIYIIFTSGNSWYYISSVDGLNFSSSSFLFSNDGIRGAGGAVFQVPDQEDGERLMLAFCTTTNHLRYFFFNGSSAYGLNTADTSGQEPRSVRLIAGSATDYTSTKYSVQVWVAFPHDQELGSMYHKEYIPSGPEGDSGTWWPSGAWNPITSSNDNRIEFTGTAYDYDNSWMVIPFFENVGDDTQMSLRIFYYKGTRHYADTTDHVQYRRSTYKSDFLVYDASLSNTVNAATQDLTTSTVIGIIEGGPPFPKNQGTWASTSNTSSVVLSASSTYENSTTWTVGGTVTLSMGKTFRKATVESKLAAGLNYTKGATTTKTATITYTCASFMNEEPNDTGWVLVLKPEIINSAYILYPYNGIAGGPLHYDGYVGDPDGDVMRLSMITYGENTFLDTYEYLLETPAEGKTHSSAFEGMGARPLGTDVIAWQDAMKETDPSYKVGYKFTSFGGTPTTTANLNTIKTTAETETWTPSANFSAKAGALGFSVEGNVNFKMDISTKTTMSYTLGFWYNVPLCDSETTCCVDLVDVTPYILTPNEDATGYDAPWISDDIRYYEKPKPWCISYRVYPDPCRDCTVTSSTPPVELSLLDAKVSLHHHRTVPNSDRISAKFILAGLAPDFSLENLGSEHVVHLRVANFSVNSDAHYVLSRYIQGNTLVLELSESEHSGDYYIVKLSHDKKRSQLKIDLEADEVDLSQLLHAYGLENVDQLSKGEAHTVPFNSFFGNKYYAEGNLRAHCVINKGNVICTLRSAK
jgi:hypothetical protein